MNKIEKLDTYILDCIEGKNQVYDSADGEYIDYSFNSINDKGWAINYCSILSTLIKEAGKCKSYSSDLFYDWKQVDRILKNAPADSMGVKVKVFGFRECGVDHKAFVDCRLRNEEVYGRSIYHSIFILVMECKDRKIEMRLYKYA